MSAAHKLLLIPTWHHAFFILLACRASPQLATCPFPTGIFQQETLMDSSVQLKDAWNKPNLQAPHTETHYE